MGDLALLDAPRFVPVILSRRLGGAALESELRRIEAEVRAGAVAVGGFVSPGEQAAARRLAALPGARLIRLTPGPLARCRPGPGGLRCVAEGRTLLLSGIPDGDGRLRRGDCVRNNRWALDIVSATPSETVSPPAAIPERGAIDPAAIFL